MKKIILIGDSIRMGYQQTVQDELTGLAEVSWPEMNGFDSLNVLAKLDDWVIARKPDIVHVNAGLHDLKKNRETGQLQVPLEDYARNVEQILRTLQAQTNLRIVWATTTPVNQEWHRERKPFDRCEADVTAYNRCAAGICRRLGVPVNDLYTLLGNLGPDNYLLPDGVHFTDQGYQLLGREVARVLRARL